MTKMIFQPTAQVSVPIFGKQDHFPVHRIYCVGRNYEAHAREMGKDPTREAPFFFLKPADTLVMTGTPIKYPPRTNNFHHEIELVVAIGKDGANISSANAFELVYGYAVGNDLTRRDLQLQARDKGRPWCTGKSFEQCASITAIYPAESVGHLSKGRIWLTVNGEKRQDSDISLLIWNVPEIIADLSTYYNLRAGDLIYTGTPEGVGPLKPGDKMEGGIDGLTTLVNTIV